MADTLITDFFEPLRALLGDLEQPQRYEDSNLAATCRTVVALNALPGYTLSVDRLSVTPGITDANLWALVPVKAAVMYVAGRPSSFSYRRRAMSESFGNFDSLFQELKFMEHKLENGEECFLGWQSLYNWLEGISGLPITALVPPTAIQFGQIIAPDGIVIPLPSA